MFRLAVLLLNSMSKLIHNRCTCKLVIKTTATNVYANQNEQLRLFYVLRWLKTVSSTKILMGCYSHALSLAATIMVSKQCPTIGEHVVVLFIT